MTQLVAERPFAGQKVPPLQAGDRLTRAEFEYRWEQHPEIKRAELIDGEVYVEMAVGREHAAAHAAVVGWGVVYGASHPDIEVLDNATVRLGADDDLQPDVAIRRRVGSSSVSGTMIEGPPEFVFEIAASSASYDLHRKLAVYERSGVAEYVVWQLFEEPVDWFRLVAGRYETVQPDEAGLFESTTFAGLRLSVAALIEGDIAAVIAALAGRQPGVVAEPGEA